MRCAWLWKQLVRLEEEVNNTVDLGDGGVLGVLIAEMIGTSVVRLSELTSILSSGA